MILSKSQFVKGVKCPKLLWYLKKGDLPVPETDERQEALYEEGVDVGKLARGLFPGGREVTFDPDDFPGMIRKTRAWIDAGVPIIYEAAAQAKGGFAMADILRRGPYGWELYEVKATGSVKDYHLYDAGFQYRVFKDFGLNLAKVAIVHIDTRYVRRGELELEELFTIEDITFSVIDLQDEIEAIYCYLAQVLNGDEPAVDIGPHCERFFGCEYAEICWSHVPEHSVFNLYRYPWSERFNLYYRGIMRIEDLPESFRPNFIQSLQIEAERTGRAMVDQKAIRAFISNLRFPLNFLDFETFAEAVPRFDGQRPYQQIPFQYSLHILHEDGLLEHREFLADETRDPRPDFIAHLLEDVTPEGSIVAFNQKFEIARIRELSAYDPSRSSELLRLTRRFADPLTLFRKGAYYHPDFNGSFSLKSVLPALFPDDPDLSYKKLEIQEGGTASEIYAALHRIKDPVAREKIRADLLAYCKLDTYAMVRIYMLLKELSGRP